ncbi:hypothetical protein PVA17_16065 [Lysinibacillus sp. CNPSo 3705]|uniref:hypothetical protein n=1 Tax=Lysinibacillus sp. CNPSo 3705 TaxID=3028148 RepID=UPI002363D9FE|nr:hypothetical protein [Lysinibacillus sp. CNPSo 3705]MDD1504261.1 hypothetical protein [Lysinibacillus sp. CNPSo 3705]
MKKEIFEWAILIWTSLLVLLITGWIMIEFYDWKDSIVAAIIAFVGAIIGGTITLIGVNKTLKDSQQKEKLNNIPERIYVIKNESAYMFNITLEIDTNFEDKEEVNKFLEKIYFQMEERLLEKNILIIGSDLYKEYNKIQDLIRGFMVKIRLGKVGNDLDYQKFGVELISKILEFTNMCGVRRRRLEDQYYRLYK